MSLTTQQNWQALQRIAVLYFKEVHRVRRGCKAEDIIAELNLPNTELMQELLAQAGLRRKDAPTPEDMCAIATMCIRGVWSESTISKETNIPIEMVRTIFESLSRGYGQAPYGLAAYGSNRRVSKNDDAVPRRVSTGGQLSYRNRRYTLGMHYAGRTGLVRERGERLLITFNDRSPLMLTRRS